MHVLVWHVFVLLACVFVFKLMPTQMLSLSVKVLIITNIALWLQA